MALIQMEFMSTSIQHYTSMNVLLPVDQWDRTETGPFPTLYLLHGWGGNYSDWVCNSRIAVWAQRRGIAVHVVAVAKGHIKIDEINEAKTVEVLFCEIAGVVHTVGIGLIIHVLGDTTAGKNIINFAY